MAVIGVAVWVLAKYQPEQPSPQSNNPPIQSREDDSSGKSDENSSKSDGASREEAEKIALDRFGGEIKETESDDYHDIPAWEVEIRNSREGRIEVKVDKKTGEILHWEHDD